MFRMSPNYQALAFVIISVLGVAPMLANANEMLLDNFEPPVNSRWSYVADTVMGGRSNGKGELLSEGEISFARLSGSVTTANNGGFIQIRRPLPSFSTSSYSGVKLIVRGNSATYFVHLRTQRSSRPWAYYQAEFFATQGWTEIYIPFEEFTASTGLLPAELKPSDLISIGIVAYGRDHKAQLDVSELALF